MYTKGSFKIMALSILIGSMGASQNIYSQMDHSEHQPKKSEKKIKKKEKKESVYYCVMHPYIKRNKPGVCPICSMQLVAMDQNLKRDSRFMYLNKRQMAQAGVVKEKARYRKLSRHIDTSGRIDYDERKISSVTAWVAGRVEKLHVNFTGIQVRKGEPLADFYSPVLINTQEEYLEARKAYKKIKASGVKQGIINAQSLVDSSKQKLLRLGLSQEQIRDLNSKKKVSDRITIFAPTSGTVIEKTVEEGRYVKEGTPLFRISDLGLVWLYADIYEYELPLVQVGQEVVVSTRAFPGQKFIGKISFIDPFIQEKTRTARVRVEIGNEDLALKPGMYARAEIHATSPQTLSVPESSVISTGKRDVLFVALEAEAIEPREVLVGRKYLYAQDKSTDRKGLFGAHSERYHEILDGVNDDEEVVKYGTFLLNAESQLQGVVAKLLPIQPAQAGEQEPKARKKDTTKLLSTAEASTLQHIKNELNPIIEHYFVFQKSLAGDSTKMLRSMSNHMKMMTSSLGVKVRSLKDDIEKKWWTEKLSEFESSMGLLLKLKEGDLDTARKWYAKFSYFILAYISRYRDHLPIDKFTAFSCPMTKAGFNRWLQKDEKINNPYMGKMMPSCGVKLDIQKIRVK